MATVTVKRSIVFLASVCLTFSTSSASRSSKSLKLTADIPRASKDYLIIIMFNISIAQISIWIWSNALYKSRGNQINIAQITILQLLFINRHSQVIIIPLEPEMLWWRGEDMLVEVLLSVKKMWKSKSAESKSKTFETGRMWSVDLQQLL